MKQIKKAFSQLDNKTLSDSKKQEIFNRILEKEKAAKKTRRNVFAIAAPLAAAAVIVVAVFVVPLIFDPQEQTTQMVKVPAPTQEVMQSIAMATDEFVVMSTIVLDLNPKVQFALNANGDVLSVQGLDADGEQLLAGIDCGGLTLENATIVVVNQLILQDYITAGAIDKQISLEIESESLGVETLEAMTRTIITAAEHHNIDVQVIANDNLQSLQIVLTGEEETEETVQAITSESMSVEFIIDEKDARSVLNVLATTPDNDNLISTIDFAGMPFSESVLYAVNDLIERGHISELQKDTDMVLTLSLEDALLADMLKYLTELLLDEAGLKIDVVDKNDNKSFELVVVDKEIAPPSKFTISQLMDATVHKTMEDLSDTQKKILQIVYTQEQVALLMERRYFVVVPDLVGLDARQAVQMLEQIGIVPILTREYSELSEQFDEGEVFYQDAPAGSMVEKSDRFQVFVVAHSPVNTVLGEGWEISTHEEETIPQTVRIATEYDKYKTGVESLYVEVFNNGAQEALCSDSFILERELNGVWYRAVSNDADSQAAQMSLVIGQSAGVKIDVAKAAGALEDGQYRILMNVNGKVCSAQFSVAIDGYSDEWLSGYAPLDWQTMEYTMIAVNENKDFVIDENGEALHQERMIEFIEKSGKGIACMVRIVTFTQAGGVIIEDFTYNGEYYIVERDTRRDVNGDTRIERSIYSYMTVGYAGGAEQILLTNSMKRQPSRDDAEIVTSYVLLGDTSVITENNVTLLVEQMKSPDDPMKVFSPDGRAVVTYADGEKVVMYEVNGEQGDYGSGIILPDDKGAVSEVLEMKWTDERRVVITYGTQQGVFERIAFDVAAMGFVPLSEDERGTMGSIAQDYFTNADREAKQEKFFDEVISFEFSIGGFGIYNTYEVKDLTLVKILQEDAGADAQPITRSWDEAKWDAFLSEVAASNVYAWDRMYDNPKISHDTQWVLKIFSEDDAVVCSGSNMYPDEFAALLAVMTEYFDEQVR